MIKKFNKVLSILLVLVLSISLLFVYTGADDVIPEEPETEEAPAEPASEEVTETLKANLFRTESRGMHYREDYPFHNDAEWLCHVGVYKADDGQVACRKIDIPDEWKGDINATFLSRYPAFFRVKQIRWV